MSIFLSKKEMNEIMPLAFLGRVRSGVMLRATVIRNMDCIFFIMVNTQRIILMEPDGADIHIIVGIYTCHYDVFIQTIYDCDISFVEKQLLVLAAQN